MRDIIRDKWLWFAMAFMVGVLIFTVRSIHNETPKRVVDQEVQQESSEYLKHSPFVGVQRSKIIEGSF
jgi:hypothetical protein